MLTTKELYEKEKELESKGIFDVHIDEPDLKNVYPVDEKFPYIRKGSLKFKDFFTKLFVIKPFIRYINKKERHTIVKGRENLKGIDSAIVTCNHVYMFDCIAAMYALRGHRLNITAAEFNNRADKLGHYMRVGGVLPMSSNLRAMKNFNNAISYFLKHNGYVMFYPEQAMWYMYEKPRPNKQGAFHYAVKNKVPVIPMFITFRKNGTKDKDGFDHKDFTVNICKPIFARDDLDEKQNMEYLRIENEKAWKEVYESTYQKELVYDIEK